MPKFPIVGRRFAAEEFPAYLGGVELEAFQPSMVVLHNTAVPSLAQRPKGFSPSNMQDLAHYYAEVQNWKGGPHLFVDQNGIWVFNPLDRRGTHSPSWNGIAWGVEMLGDFEREDFGSGPGLLVRQNAVAAVAAMFLKLGIEPTEEHFKLHREDTQTTHACPGKGVSKSMFRSAVVAKMAELRASDGARVKIVVYRKGKGQHPFAVIAGTLSGGVTKADAGDLSAGTGIEKKHTGRVSVRSFVGDRFDVTWHAENAKAYLVER